MVLQANSRLGAFGGHGVPLGTTETSWRQLGLHGASWGPRLKTNGSLEGPEDQLKSKWAPSDTIEDLGASYGPRSGVGGAPFSEYDFQVELMWPQKLIWRTRGSFEDYFPVFERALPKK